MATTKTAGREVVSLDALAKQRRDALPEPTTFDLAGVEFTLPPIKALPFELQEKVGSYENVVGVMKEVLGIEKVKEMYAAGYQLGDLELIAEEWQKRSGVEPGESAASTAS
ncbi:hypothetical protein [Streptomyces candidus]|uniref:Tail assembly chaperone n=1 Tax=Streptomyces candidus TaxID=67283 RepID=A0A7X0HLK5_9ACTN|nr:hypothetical protein [Streptomyces candidus]MBB6439914.1 hypothetical protein [Streptomyces candidus]GHH57908.1 hypothetical protein GCM10018773_65870 [Streptomyces candidus]